VFRIVNSGTGPPPASFRRQQVPDQVADDDEEAEQESSPQFTPVGPKVQTVERATVLSAPAAARTVLRLWRKISGSWAVLYALWKSAVFYALWKHAGKIPGGGRRRPMCLRIKDAGYHE
jgi:hypothetical protein